MVVLLGAGAAHRGRVHPEDGVDAAFSTSSSEEKCPRQDSNLRTRLRRAVLYPLSYGGSSWWGRGEVTSPSRRRGRRSSGCGQRCPAAVGEHLCHQGGLGRLALDDRPRQVADGGEVGVLGPVLGHVLAALVVPDHQPEELDV